MKPSKLHLHKKTQMLDIHFGSEAYSLSAEFLRVQSPSAEVRGHGSRGGQLPYGKKTVSIKSIVPSGNYAVRLCFSDGHDSGLYTWAYLKLLCDKHDECWQNYLDQLHEQGLSRVAEAQILTFEPPGTR